MGETGRLTQREAWEDLIDLERLVAWMDAQRLGHGDVSSPTLLTGGTQNLLLKFRRGDREYVLRRPPLHPRADGNETMRREARILAALANTDVPHPKLLASSSDDGVLGTAFLLMEPVEGFNATVALPALHAANPGIRFDMGLALIDGIKALARVDYRAAHLNDAFQPAGYLDRQIQRWLNQLASYHDYSGWPGPRGIPGVDAVADWLRTGVPRTFTPGIIHGDYHLANVMYCFDSGKLAAIVDWELSAIGDPLIDLGWLLATWPDEHGENPSGVTVRPWDGFPSQAQVIARYAAGNQRDLSALHWYKVFACFKFGIVLEGSYARAAAGKASVPIGERMHNAATGLFQRALKLIN
jgi:aminoglycoside phosphotransferase (APT) family kinase protein